MSEMRYAVAEERVVQFDLPDSGDLHIEGILRGEACDPLVVMMHGLGGKANATLQFLGARYLHERGFNTLRLNMYGYGDGTRNLHDCLVQTHVEDFEVVADNLRSQGVERLFAIGHSVGGLTLLRSKIELEGAVLWDPSHGNWWRAQNETSSPDVVYAAGSRIDLQGVGSIWSQGMQREFENMGDTTTLAKGKGYPMKIVSALDGELIETNRAYAEAADEPKELHEIKGATHNFDDSDRVMLELFEETADWFEGIRQ